MGISLLEGQKALLPIDVPVYVNGERIGIGEVHLDYLGGEVEVYREGIDTLIERVISDQGLDHFYKLLENDQMPKDELVQVSFDQSDQSVHFSVAPQLIRMVSDKVRKSSVREYSRSASQEVDQSPVSGYINVLAGQRFNRTYFTPFNYTSSESFGNFDCVLNIYKWVLEGFVYYLGRDTNGLNRGNVSLTRDLPDEQVRITLGDINTLGVGYQSTMPLVGMSVHKNRTLFTDAAVGPMSRHELFLNAPSKVEVYLNGILTKVLQLNAGPHTLEDFPLVDGMNEVQLKVIGPTGEERLVDLNYFYNGDLLPKGETEYYLALGWSSYDPRLNSKGFQHYTNSLQLSGNYAVGLTNQIALSTYFQGTKHDFFGGGQLIYVNPSLRVLVDGGVSYYSDYAGDLRGRIALSPAGKEAKHFTWKLAGEYIGRKFGYIGQVNPENAKRFVLSSSLNFVLSNKCSLGFVGEAVDYHNEKHSFLGQMMLSMRLLKSLSLKAIGKLERLRTGNNESSFVVALDLIPSQKNVSIRSNYNSKQEMLTSDINFSRSLDNHRSISANGGYTRAPGTQQATGSLQYEGLRANLGGSHYISKLSSTISDSTMSTTSWNLGSALAFAGRKFTISKPIRDSFVIVSPNRFLKESAVLINPDYKGEFLARGTYWLPACVPMNSYRYNEVHISTEGEIMGLDFERESFSFIPSYKGGGLISIGKEPTYIVEGYLQTNALDPIARVGGLLVEVGGDTKRSYPFFTDSRGKFQLVGVPEGTFVVKLVQDGIDEQTIQVAPLSAGLNFCDLGKVTCPLLNEREIVQKLNLVKEEE